MMKRSMADAVLSIKEYNWFTKGIFGWVGFKTRWMEFENVERVAGETKWSFWKLFKYALEGIIAFSTVPLTVVSVVGVVVCMASFLHFMHNCVFAFLREWKIFCMGSCYTGWIVAAFKCSSLLGAVYSRIYKKFIKRSYKTPYVEYVSWIRRGYSCCFKLLCHW